MQWLIDIIAEKVIAEIGIPPTFIDRGDPTPPDLTITDFTINGAWHDLDLSSIVPAGAKAVLITLFAGNAQTYQDVSFRRAGNTGEANASAIFSQVSYVLLANDLVCPINADRHIEYKFSMVGWYAISFTIKGWWL